MYFFEKSLFFAWSLKVKRNECIAQDKQTDFDYPTQWVAGERRGSFFGAHFESQFRPAFLFAFPEGVVWRTNIRPQNSQTLKYTAHSALEKQTEGGGPPTLSNEKGWRAVFLNIVTT